MRNTSIPSNYQLLKIFRSKFHFLALCNAQFVSNEIQIVPFILRESCELLNYQVFAAVRVQIALPVQVEFTVGAKMGTGATRLYPWDMPRQSYWPS